MGEERKTTDVCPAQPNSLVRKRAGRKREGEPRQTCSSKSYASAEIDFRCIIGLTHKLQPLLAGAGSGCPLACFSRCLSVLGLLLESSVFQTDDKSSSFLCVHESHGGILSVFLLKNQKLKKN